jgi:hypothetical protein
MWQAQTATTNGIQVIRRGSWNKAFSALKRDFSEYERCVDRYDELGWPFARLEYEAVRTQFTSALPERELDFHAPTLDYCWQLVRVG